MVSGVEIDELLAIVAGGEKLGSVLYGYQQVQPQAQEILVTMLARFRAPIGGTLRVQARHADGPFELIVVEASWKPSGTADGFFPIILRREGPHLRVVGNVLPFNDVLQLLTPDDMEHIRPLASFWIKWLELRDLLCES